MSSLPFESHIDTTMDITPKYWKNIRKIRELKSISPEFIASKLELDISTYRKIERGEVSLAINKLPVLCEAMAISIETLFSFDEGNLLQNCNQINGVAHNTSQYTTDLSKVFHEMKALYDRVILLEVSLKEKDMEIERLKLSK
jgi:transcriptional regulator with XRE-family HTH domain